VDKIYNSQVALLLSVLPEVAKETCFALHGGTAINLFVRNMPRLSVDLDLTYIPVENRTDTLQNITQALARIMFNIKRILPNVQAILQHENLKLQVTSNNAQVKIEVNQAIRGVIDNAKRMELCDVAQDKFDAFCAIQVVPFEQLYGGKICAALDRQHPRDLFDIKYLLKNEGFTPEIKKGFIFCLLSSKRPLSEILFPNFLDQNLAKENQFKGMASEPFSYQDFEETREILVRTIHENLNREDKKFLLSFKNLTPDWSIYDFERFPAVQWKMQNLQKLKDNNSKKYAGLYKHLAENLEK